MRVLLLGVAFLLSGAAADWVAVCKAIPAKVGRLEMLVEGASGPGVCTAVVLNAKTGYALTAGHCVAKDQTKRLDLTFNRRHATVVRENALLDLAVINFEVHTEQAIEFADTVPDAGGEIAIVGYAFGLKQLVVQFGHVGLPLEHDNEELWLDGVVIPGDSGGAVLNAEGKLIGMTTAVHRAAGGAAHIAAAVPVGAVRDFVKPYLPREK